MNRRLLLWLGVAVGILGVVAIYGFTSPSILGDAGLLASGALLGICFAEMDRMDMADLTGGTLDHLARLRREVALLEASITAREKRIETLETAMAEAAAPAPDAPTS